MVQTALQFGAEQTVMYPPGLNCEVNAEVSVCCNGQQGATHLAGGLYEKKTPPALLLCDISKHFNDGFMSQSLVSSLI